MIATALAGCASPEWHDLALAEDWSLVTPAADPWPDRPNDAEACPDRAAVVESGSIEVDTNLCDWITITAPARRDVRAGGPIEMLFFHSALATEEEEGGEAVMAVAFGDAVLFGTLADVALEHDVSDRRPKLRMVVEAAEHILQMSSTLGVNSCFVEIVDDRTNHSCRQGDSPFVG